jgi:Tfp pilus assembly protein PilV
MYQVQTKMRQAIAMIELIFAIVIIGITMLSAPQILNVSIQSSNVAMQQEAIAAAGSQIGLVLTRNWDERDSNGTTGYGILQVDHNRIRELDGCNMTRKYNTTAGFTHATAEANFGTDAGDNAIFDDMDDFHGSTQTLQLYASETASLTNNEGEYLDKEGIYMTTQIMYGNDSASYTSSSVTFNNPFLTSGGSSSNIKIIKVRLQTTQADDEHKKDISLSAFSCNIGTPTPGVTPML